MKLVKRYLFFGVLLAIAFLAKFYILDLTTTGVDTFRGGNLSSRIWNVLVANDVNSDLFTVLIDNHEFDNVTTDIYMDENRNIMVPISILRDSMNCSVHVYDGTTLLVEKHNYSVSFDKENGVAISGEEQVSLKEPLQYKSGQFFISLDDLSNLLDYTGGFDLANRKYVTADSSEDASSIPKRYDLREKGRVSSIRNQGKYGTCWANAACSALESSLLPEKAESFAVDHMSLCNSFYLDQMEGGTYAMGMAYLAAWQGPVYEANDPYGDGVSDSSLTPVYHVQEMRIIEGKDYESIKEAVFKYGGVQTSLYSTITSAVTSNKYYDSFTNSYCYIGTEKPNHEVVIIGWDDNYPAENFKGTVEGDGAFICQNSWGTNFGDDGVFYVSYYDTNIGSHNVVYTRIDSVDNYDNIYQSDLCGWVGKIGYGKDSIYGANVFTAKSDEAVKAAGFYALGTNTEYQVYIINNFVDENSFTGAKLVASGTFEDAGFYTVDFDREINVSEGERYAVLVYLKSPGLTHPLAIEYNTGDKYYANLDLSDGEGYISKNGRDFTNVMDLDDPDESNICIKAYTDNK